MSLIRREKNKKETRTTNGNELNGFGNGNKQLQETENN